MLGPDGLPVQVGPEILDAATFAAVQAELDRRRKASARDRSGRSRRASLLLGVGFCECGAPLTAGTTSTGKRRYACTESRKFGEAKCRIVQSVDGERLDEIAERRFLGLVGRLPVVEVVTVPGEDHTAEIRELRASLERLDEAWRVGAFEADPGTYADMRRGIQRRLQDLESRPATGPTAIERETGETFAHAWARASTETRRELMQSAGFRVYVGPARGRGRHADTEGRCSFAVGVGTVEEFD